MPRKKKRSAWASLTEVQPNVWRLRYWAEGADGYRRRSKTVRGTRKQAEAVRAQLMLEHGDDAPCPTVQQAWERWALPTYQRRVDDGELAPASYDRYTKAWKNLVAPRWANVTLDAVRPLQVQQWISSLTLTQAKIAVVVLSAVMDHAVRYEQVEHNPMREKYLMPPKSTVKRRDDGTWTLAELLALSSELRGLWFEPAFLLAAFGSCRVGESLGAMAGEVEMRRVSGVPVAVIPIVRQVPNVGGPTERLKTAESRRTVVLAGNAALRLHELASALPPDWYLTHDGIGKWQSQSRLNDSWNALKMAHPFGNLRPSWQTWMRYEARIAVPFIEALMGHRRPGVTGLHYDRPTPDVLAEVVADAYLSRNWDDLWR